MPTAKPKKPSSRITAIRTDTDTLDRLARVMHQKQRSRSWLINQYIQEGLKRDERKGSGSAFD